MYLHKNIVSNQNCFILVSQVGVLLHLLYNNMRLPFFSYEQWCGGWKVLWECEWGKKMVCSASWLGCEKLACFKIGVVGGYQNW